MMQTLTCTLVVRSAFGTLLKGDTLFGQLCWAIRNRLGENALQEMLEGYADNRPFLIVSDAFPKGYLPRPVMPLSLSTIPKNAERKQLKKQRWLPVEKFVQPLENWLLHCVSDKEIASDEVLFQQVTQTHNTINRATGTTGRGQFAPYTSPVWRFAVETELQLYLLLDEDRISADVLQQLLTDIGMIGFGRDASVGMGKFEVTAFDNNAWPSNGSANAWLTLAPCQLPVESLDAEQSYYQPFTRFGRHGDMAVHKKNPFKTPLLLADMAAVLKPSSYENVLFVGSGIGGDGTLSKAIPQTVHQGYAPVLPVEFRGAQ